MFTSIAKLSIIILLVATMVQSSPFAGLKLCGRALADTLSEVCSERGYNDAFSHDGTGSFNDRRFKRGIVDECCRRMCTWSTLETYCSPVTSSPATYSDNPTVSKRNSITENVKVPDEKLDTSRLGYGFSTEMQDDMTEQTRHHKRRLFAHGNINLWQATSKRLTAQYLKNRSHTLQGQHINNKVKRNDPPSGIPTSLDSSLLNSLPKDTSLNEAMLESEEILAQLNDPKTSNERIRHSRTHSTKVFKLKDSPQIGTVSPYFLGRTLVLPTSRKTRFLNY